MARTKLLMTTSAALFALGTAASAATLLGDECLTRCNLSLGDQFVDGQDIAGGGELTYTFDVLDALTIENFTVTGSGFDSGADLMNVRFGSGLVGASDVANNSYDEIFVYGSVASAVAGISGQTFEAGDSFFFTFLNQGDDADAAEDAVGVTMAFDTVAPIPVPAAGFLLLGALGAGALVGRRKKVA